MLRQQEILALKLVFRGGDKLSVAVRDRINEATSFDWEETGVGFYSTIKLKQPLDQVPDIRMWSYAFEHPDFPNGGVFNCMIVGADEIELEGVTLGGDSWPYPTNYDKFKEIID